MRLIFLIVLLASCAPPLSQQPAEVNSELVSYIDQFEEISGQRYTGRTIFSTKEFLQQYGEQVIALCFKYTSGKKEIYIDEEFWEQADETYKQEAIFHELGHCVLNREHDSSLIAGSEEGTIYTVPRSIMYPYVFGGRLYTKFYDYYTQELIGNDVPLTYTGL